MFVDLDSPLNASSLLSASAELLVLLYVNDTGLYAITHTQEYALLVVRLGWYDIHLLFSVLSQRQTCAPRHKILATPLASLESFITLSTELTIIMIYVNLVFLTELSHYME